MKKLIYVMDPHCGWCYGNSDNMQSVYREFKDRFEMEILVGGMWLGENAPQGSENLFQFIKVNGPRMEQTTGVTIGDGYHALTRDTSYVFDSFPPCAAIVCVKQLDSSKAFDFTKKVQEALYKDGLRLDKLDSYLPILEALDLSTTDFQAQWLSDKNRQDTKLEFSKAQTLARGYPTLILESNTQKSTITSGYFNRKEMMRYLESVAGEE